MRATKLPALGAIAGLALLAACASDRPTAEVTRFHIGVPASRGAVALVPANPALAGTVEFQTYAGAAGAELSRLGYTIVPNPAAAELIGALSVEQRVRPGAARRSSVSFGIGLGGGSFGRGGGGFGGASVGTSVPVGQARGNDLVDTRVGLQLKRRSDQSVEWEGRAETEAKGGSPYAQPGPAVQRLTAAMLQGFPGPTGQTVRVPLQ